MTCLRRVRRARCIMRTHTENASHAAFSQARQAAYAIYVSSNAIYVSSNCYICVLILLRVCSACGVRCILSGTAGCICVFSCSHTAVYVSSCCLRRAMHSLWHGRLHMCVSHTAVSVSSYCYMCSRTTRHSLRRGMRTRPHTVVYVHIPSSMRTHTAV